MEQTRKRSFSDHTDGYNNCSTTEIQRHNYRPPQKRQRTARHYPVHASFQQLQENYNFFVDVGDVLEDYLNSQKKTEIRPLVLDTDSGDWWPIEECTLDNSIIKPGSSVKLKNGTFLRVDKILEEQNELHIVLRGHHLVRTSRLKPILDVAGHRQQRELVLNVQINKGSTETTPAQAMIDVPLDWAHREVKVQFSNYNLTENEPQDMYFCRWKLTRYYKDTMRERKQVEVAIERLTFTEADASYKVSDTALKIDWRGETKKGGSADGFYTALDGFCCGGGWSRGATMAGNVKVVRSFDKEEKACKTYEVNFPEANCLNLDVFDYCIPGSTSRETWQLATTPRYLDIAHYSTPCQFFSPAHTRAGPNDEMNFAASFCLSNLLEKDRPRVVTFENTAGLERRHFEKLKAIFGQITSTGYNLRFTCLNLADYGLPQSRKRLIMLASCPGEPLPSFPEPTHSQNGERQGTRPWTTLVESLSSIPWEGWQNHQPSKMKKRPAPPPTQSLAPTITCAGEMSHPDGRQFTICEYQVLQGFPLHHRFSKDLSRADMRSQIGNAFPPIFVKKLLRSIRKQLQTTDGIAQSVDPDENMTEEQLRDEQIAQFFRDHEKLPEGSRANISFLDGAQDSEDEDEDIEEETQIEQDPDDDLFVEDAGGWSFVTKENVARRDSNRTIVSIASSSQSSQISTPLFSPSPQASSQSSIDSYDFLDKQPNDNLVLTNRIRSSMSKHSITPSGRKKSSLISSMDIRSATDRAYDNLGRDMGLVRRTSNLSLSSVSSPSTKGKGSQHDPIEL